MSFENCSNCIAALFEAAGNWADVGTEEQTALGGMLLNEVNGATQTWSQAKFQLGKGDTYSEIPTSFQASWMSRGAVSAMGRAAEQAITKSYNYWNNGLNSAINASHEGVAYSTHESEWQAGLNRIAPVFGALNQGNDSGVAAFFALTKGLEDGTISASFLSKLPAGYLHHEVTGGATIQQLTDHVKQLLQENANGGAVQAAQALLGEAQVWQQNQTACANAGVKQAQGYLTTVTDEVLGGLRVAQGLAGMLKLLQRELAK